MRVFYIVANIDKPGVEELTDDMESFLVSNKAVVYKTTGYIERSTVPKDVEVLITLGGDGTLIRAARDVAGLNIPLIGVNMGHLGYLTVARTKEEVFKMLNLLLEDKYDIEKRMLLSGYAVKRGMNSKKYLAMNEILISRVLSGKAIKCKINVDGEFLNEYVCDGIIISTPTGSTAYNLSAGGPIAEPASRMIIITPVCPHALLLRSVVLSSDKLIDIEIIGESSGERVAVFDGEDSLSLVHGDHVIIKEAKIKTHLIKLENGSFFENLRNKISNV